MEIEDLVDYLDRNRKSYVYRTVDGWRQIPSINYCNLYLSNNELSKEIIHVYFSYTDGRYAWNKIYPTSSYLSKIIEEEICGKLKLVEFHEIIYSLDHNFGLLNLKVL